MSQLQVNRINDASGGVLAPISSVMRNRIINGAMVVSQRNGTSSVTPGSLEYTLDRWRTLMAGTSARFSVQQNAGSVTPPAGFTNYLGVTSLSAHTLASGDQYAIQQWIEGFNIADLGWGTANAKTVTLSFWVRSSLTGTFGGSIGNSGGGRSYPFTYTINAANTWEYETITIVGDTGGTWLTDNSRGLSVAIGLGVGSTLSGTAGAWSGSDFRSATGAASVVGTNGATFYITGVQLEKGTQATSFEYRQYGQELALCQRYYINAPIATLVSSVAGGFSSAQYPVTMRATPTVVISPSSGTAGGATGTPLGWYSSFTAVTGVGYTASSEL